MCEQKNKEPDPDSSKTGILLAVQDSNARSFAKKVSRIYRPNTGLQAKTETASVLSSDSSRKKVLPDVAEKIWKRIFEESNDKCSHKVRLGRCARINCDVGLRKRTYHVLSGSILHFWSKMESDIQEINKLQIVRLNIKDNLKIIGILIPERAVKKVLDILRGPPPPVTRGSLSDVKSDSTPTISSAVNGSMLSTPIISTSSMTKSKGTSLLAKKED